MRSSFERVHLRLFLMIFLSILLISSSSCKTEAGTVDSGNLSGIQEARQGAGPLTRPETVEPQLSGWEEISETPTYPVYFTLTPVITMVSPIIISSPTPTPSPTSVPFFRMCSPLEDHTLDDLLDIVSFPYDPPPEGKDSGHHGVDFAYYRRGERLSILGVPIQSVLPGKAAAVVLNRAPYGYMLIVETFSEDISPELKKHVRMENGESLYLLYAHMNTPPFIEVGEAIGCGGIVGEVGNTPPEWSSAPHLHFEARVGPSGETFESMAFYTKTASPEEMDAYRHWRTSGDFRLVDPLELLIFGLSASH